VSSAPDGAPDAVRFRTIQSLTGPQAIVGTSIEVGLRVIAQRAAAEGLTVDLDLLDDHSDPQRARALHDELADPGPLLLAPGSSNCLAAVLASPHRRVGAVMTSAGGQENLVPGPPVHQVAVTPDQIAIAMSEAVSGLGAAEVVLAVNTAKVGLSAGADAMARALSASKVAVIRVDVDEASPVVPQLASPRGGGTRVLAAWLGGPAAVDVAARARAAGWEVVLPSTADTAQFLRHDAGTEGCLVATHRPSLNGGGADVEALRASLGEHPNAFVVNGAAAMQVALGLLRDPLGPIRTVLGTMRYDASGGLIERPAAVIGRVVGGRLVAL